MQAENCTENASVGEEAHLDAQFAQFGDSGNSIGADRSLVTCFLSRGH